AEYALSQLLGHENCSKTVCAAQLIRKRGDATQQIVGRERREPCFLTCLVRLSLDVIAAPGQLIRWAANLAIKWKGQARYENYFNCYVDYYGFCPCAHASEEQGCQSKDPGRTGDNKYAKT